MAQFLNFAVSRYRFDRLFGRHPTSRSVETWCARARPPLEAYRRAVFYLLKLNGEMHMFAKVITLPALLSLAAFATQAVIKGTNGDDTLIGTNESDVINGKAGNDLLLGEDGDDILNGGAGDDDLEGDEPFGNTGGDDVLNGGPGNDDLRGWLGDDLIHGGSGDDFLLGGEGHDQMLGGPGSDILRGLEGDDVHIGGDGDDLLQLIQGSVRIQLPGLPPIKCVAADEWDVANAGDGDDTVEWVSGEVLFAAPFPACISAGSGQADGGDGFDTLHVGLQSFSALSSDYVIEAGTVAGFPQRLRSLETGATLDFRNFEEIEFFDITIPLP